MNLFSRCGLLSRVTLALVVIRIESSRGSCLLAALSFPILRYQLAGIYYQGAVKLEKTTLSQHFLLVGSESRSSLAGGSAKN